VDFGPNTLLLGADLLGRKRGIFVLVADAIAEEDSDQPCSTELGAKPQAPGLDTKNMTGSVRTVYIVAFPGAEILDITGPMEVFAFANIGLQQNGVITEPAYQIALLAEKPGPVMTSCGLKIIADRAYSEVTDGIDTLLIAGAPDVNSILCDPVLKEWIRTMAPCVRRVSSVCTGAFLLAESGLLDGRRATSHWGYCRRLAQDYPSVRVEPDQIFIRDGRISTSGGVTSGIDLAMAMVEEDWGRKVALSVAQMLVVFVKRPGGQSQFSAYIPTEASRRPDLRDLQAWIMGHPTEDLGVEILADRMEMSPRNFARTFLSETGMTPAKFVEMARIDAARQHLVSSELPIDVVAEKSGFRAPEQMRRAFLNQLGVNPHDYRARFSSHHERGGESRSGSEQGKLAAIMFTDMVGYSALSQRDEGLALELLEEHRALLRPAFLKHQGLEVKTIGDGFLVEFVSAVAAVNCAVELQEALARRNLGAPADRLLQVRIGIHLGDVVHRGDDIVGDGVNIAARVEPLADSGGIAITQQVFDQVYNKIPEILVSIGKVKLKNIQRPVGVYRIVLGQPVRS
jgi:transcriptional regulator GlxA family with amidase domain